LVVGLIVASGCGVSKGDGACHETADCAAGLDCSGPDDPPVCGVAPRQECATDTDCTTPGDRCHAIADSCSADGIGSECRAACQSDAECGAGFACPSGACVAVSCDAGFTCEAREVCDPSRITGSTPVYDRTHGCFAVACTADADCGPRFCVNSTCQDGEGTCVKPMLVP
jgi:hypothetical protein